MSIEAEIPNVEAGAAKKVAGQIVYLMALLATVLGVLYLIGLLGKLIVDGTVHSASSPSIQIISAIVAILLNLSLLIMFVALRRQIPRTNAVFAELAVVFAALVCVASTINWFVQLTVLPRIAQDGDSSLLALIDVHNANSVMYAIEHLGWGIFYGLATIFMAMAMGKGKLESWIRSLLVGGGVLSLLHVIGIIITNSTMTDLGYIAWGVFLPVTTTLLAIRFRRN